LKVHKIEAAMFESEEMKELRRKQYEDDAPEQEAADEEPVKTGSRYKRGRHWWEQSKWERKR
jgi:hypothetical protein